MDFGKSARRMFGGIEHYLIAIPEGGVSLNVVGVGLMVLDSAKVIAGDLLREANLLDEI